MGIVIPFEVVRQDKPETEEETRIAEKEAIYRGLIEQRALREGKPFKEMEEKYRAMDKRQEERRQQRGTGSRNYEHELDRNIKSLRYVVKVFTPLMPEGAKLG